MKLFNLSADIDFYAEDINDAFVRLAHHFLTLYNVSEQDRDGANYESMIVAGNIEVKPK